ncbi:hypothetical protein KCP73_23485 [Salmonella enterica subsp. enterica]|nr:hypothetical protein KCP73_23485 [Salmonella enterica subsp. enterica]
MGKYNVILSEQQLAGQLGKSTAAIQIRLMVPICQPDLPMGRLPSQRLFTVISTFAANQRLESMAMKC